MIKLPTTLFSNIMTMFSAKDVLTMKVLCKHTHYECEKRALWKSMLKAQYPNFPLSEDQDFETIIRGFGGCDDFVSKIDDFKFLLIFWKDGKKTWCV